MSNKDTKEKEESSVSWSYHGKEDEWDAFDRRMLRYMRKKFDNFGEKIWLGHCRKIETLETVNYNNYCTEVWNAISINNPGEAKDLWTLSSGFWERTWQESWIKRQQNLMCDYIEEHAKGQAEMVMVNFSGDKAQIRKYLYKQFGSGAGGDIHLKELEYDKGMPEKGKPAFPIGVNMPEKLRQLESRRIYFWKMCLPEKRESYLYCQESKLVRIVLDHINEDYSDCVSRLLDLVKIRKMIKDVKEKDDEFPYDITDSHERSFNDDWLPKWKQLESSLNLEYKNLCQKAGRKTEVKLPVAVGTTSENREVVRCYSCGEFGHKKGDGSCKAGRYDVHPCAPPEFRQRQESKRKKYGGSQDNPKSPKKSRQGKDSKKICHAFQNGGTCRYGASCKFSHNRKEGGLDTFSPAQQRIVSAMVASAVKKTAKTIARKARRKKGTVSVKDEDNLDFASMMASCLLAPVRNTIRREFNYDSSVVLKSKLHDVNNNVGIDSDAAISISTLRKDFLWIDSSHQLMSKLPAPSGINGGSSTVGGIGPMLVMTKSGKFLLDPEAMFVEPGDSQPDFRVMSTQRLKMNGIRIVGCWNDTELDVLQDRKSKEVIHLSEEGPAGNAILVLETKPLPLINNRSELRMLVDEVSKGNKSALIKRNDFEVNTMEVNNNLNTFLLNLKRKSFKDLDSDWPVLVFNIAKLTPIERTRLYMRKFGMCSNNLLLRMSADNDFGSLPKFANINEDNPLKDASKYSKQPHSRTDPEISMCHEPWERTYVDGYGGGNSMGTPSFEGAIGGYLFVCPSVGELHHKLYSSHEQFPIAVFQFLLHVEGEGNKCNKLYCDTFSVNISAELEEVCALFFCKIVPVSAGTPQEVSFVETQHRIIAGRSRAMLLGAPHLPGWAWALSDKYACYVGRHLPQSTRKWKSAAFLNSGKIPDWRYLSIYVFGAPCRFAPMDGPVHKRGEMTEEGYFVGVQHPMLIIIRKRDMEVISVSKKKVIVYESFYTCPLSVPPSELNPTIDGTWTQSNCSNDRFKPGGDNISSKVKNSITNKSDYVQDISVNGSETSGSGNQVVTNFKNATNCDFGIANARSVDAFDADTNNCDFGIANARSVDAFDETANNCDFGTASARSVNVVDPNPLHSSTGSDSNVDSYAQDNTLVPNLAPNRRMANSNAIPSPNISTDSRNDNNSGDVNKGNNNSVYKNLDSIQSTIIPKHRKSVKSLNAHTVPVPGTTAHKSFRPPTTLDSSAQQQVANLGEGHYTPEHLEYNVSDLQTCVNELKSKVNAEIDDLGIRETILKSLDKAQDRISGNVIKKGYLSKGKKQKNEINVSNIVTDKRKRTSGKSKLMTPKSSKKTRSSKKTPKKLRFKNGDYVSADSTLFDGNTPGSYSDENPGRQFGVVIQVWAGNRNIVKILWEDGESSYQNVDDLRYEKSKINASMVVTLVLSSVFNKEEDPLDKTKWPQDFFHALVRDDWRDWVMAVKKEINSWMDFDAYSEIPYEQKTPGASIVPLGELYTRKRDLSYKFRQYLMGNLLKKGKDYDETFSACISWDGIRWCAAVACVAGKLIHGLDAVTGFLQAKEQFDLYAYLPSHGKYSELSFEELAVLRLKLLDLIKAEGEEGLRKFAKMHKRESRQNPKTCYKLNSSIYGAPSANHEWDMVFQNAHINKCGLTLSEIEPSLYVKICVDDEDRVVDWLIANIWTDDVRYFGTDRMVKEYELELQKHVKVKFLGVPGEFVGTDFVQNIELGTCELKAPKYWESALIKVDKYFKNGLKERFNPLSVYDEKIMEEEVSDQQYEEAKHLEYRELIGIISYQAGCTKLEMRYAVSVCSRFRNKWGVRQFNVVKKLFEYGYTTRFTGIIYSKGLDKHGDNTLYCFGDSGHSLPRSYGCTIILMNGGALSLSAKRHTITASSTCHDELIEYSIATNKVVGFRNIMSEMGLSQAEATTIYQDNEAAIQISMNRGALSKQSRHMDRKILTARNKIEDRETLPKYIETSKMLADIGTKALSDKQFAYLRDQLTGYSLVKAHHPSYTMPDYVGGGN